MMIVMTEIRIETEILRRRILIMPSHITSSKVSRYFIDMMNEVDKEESPPTALFC